jgi:hypothetical protein
MATLVKGSVKVGRIDGRFSKDLVSQYGIKKYPAVKLFKPKAKHEPPEDFVHSGEPSGSALAQSVLSLHKQLSQEIQIPHLNGDADVRQK